MLEKSRDYVTFLQKKLDKYLLGQGDQALGESRVFVTPHNIWEHICFT